MNFVGLPGLVRGFEVVVVGVSGPAEVVRIRAICFVDFLEHLRQKIGIVRSPQRYGHSGRWYFKISPLPSPPPHHPHPPPPPRPAGCACCSRTYYGMNTSGKRWEQELRLAMYLGAATFSLSILSPAPVHRPPRPGLSAAWVGGPSDFPPPKTARVALACTKATPAIGYELRYG